MIEEVFYFGEARIYGLSKEGLQDAAFDLGWKALGADGHESGSHKLVAARLCEPVKYGSKKYNFVIFEQVGLKIVWLGNLPDMIPNGIDNYSEGSDEWKFKRTDVNCTVNDLIEVYNEMDFGASYNLVENNCEHWCIAFLDTLASKGL